jgi:hypothetical protein
MPDRQPKPMSVVPPSPPCASTRSPWRPLTFSAAAMPVATAAALPNSEWIHGSCQEVSGYGVENTSRQPVALAAISRPCVARSAASTAKRAPSTSPQPWQARCPELIALLRSALACTLRCSGASRRLPTVKVPVW